MAMIITNIEYNKKLSNLVKIYTDDAKYSSCNDRFIFKQAIFYDICSKANILSKAKMKTFSIILKNLALDYYYSNINTSTIIMNFD